MEAPRHIIRRTALAVSAVAVFAAAALGLAVPSASATTTLTATTHLTNRLDGGHNTLGAPYWATDTITRVATLVDNGPDVNRSGFDTFSFSLSDTGTFVTNNNVGNPNGLNPTTPITGTVTGTIKGSGIWTTFDAPTGSANASLVPTSISGNGTPSSVWPGLFFPLGTDFECPGVQLQAYTTATSVQPFPPTGCGSENTYSYTYKSCSEQWVDSNTDNDGDASTAPSNELAIIGGISGKDCPEPSPSPSHHHHGFPTGGVQTGGGIPASNSRVPLIAVLSGLGMLIVAGFGIARLRRQRG